jgi:hypothetical protein
MQVLMALSFAIPANPTEMNRVLSSEATLSDLIEKWKLVGRSSTDCSPEAAPSSVVRYEIDASGLATIDNVRSIHGFLGSKSSR